MESFSLTMEGDTVIVRGRKHRDQAVNNLSQRGFWQLFRSNRPAEVDEWESVELRYTPEQLSHMDDEGRSKRGNLGSPDAHSASQIVRAVGALVDQKQARLTVGSQGRRKNRNRIRVTAEGHGNRGFHGGDAVRVLGADVFEA